MIVRRRRKRRRKRRRRRRTTTTTTTMTITKEIERQVAEMSFFFLLFRRCLEKTELRQIKSY